MKPIMLDEKWCLASDEAKGAVPGVFILYEPRKDKVVESRGKDGGTYIEHSPLGWFTSVEGAIERWARVRLVEGEGTIGEEVAKIRADLQRLKGEIQLPSTLRL